MSRMRAWVRLLAALMVACLVGAGPASATTKPAHTSPMAEPAPSRPLALALQPLGFPSGVIGATLARDRILQAALQRLGRPLAAQSYTQGTEPAELLAAARLDAAVLGDMPTLHGAASGHSLIVGLTKQAPVALVARDVWQVAALAGKRIGYVDSSTSHHALLQGLASAGLSERDVRLVPIPFEQMVAALERGEIDAFAAGEPAPSLALQASSAHRIVFRSLSADYLVLGKHFVAQAPEAARELIAAYLRAFNWLRASQRHLDQAAAWTLADAHSLLGRPLATTVPQLAAIARRDILDVPGAPSIVRDPRRPPLLAEFAFLHRLNKLPAGASTDLLAHAFAYDGLAQVARQARRYRLHEYHYGD